MTKNTTLKLLLEKINLLDPRDKLIIKEKISVFGKFDYPGKEILMNLTNKVLIHRLFPCKKEPETFDWIKEYLNKGDVMYDIGANIGGYSFIANAHLDGECHIYSFEPSFSNFNTLVENIILNKTEKSIIPFNISLGNSDKVALLNYAYLEAGNGINIMDDVYWQGKNIVSKFSQPVLCFSIDSFVQKFNIKLPNIVKIDVEGSEYKIILGAKKTFSYEGLKSILVEIDENSNAKNEIENLLLDYGFKFKEKYERLLNNKVFNYIFVRK